LSWAKDETPTPEHTQEAARVALDHVAASFRSRWRDLYEAQRREAAHVAGLGNNIFERAAFVFWNSRSTVSRPLLRKESRHWLRVIGRTLKSWRLSRKPVVATPQLICGPRTS
jgi:hypothetical protein